MPKGIKSKLAESGSHLRYSRGSVAWLIYFLFSIAVVGFGLAYLAAAPLYALGYLWKPALRAADTILQLGIHLLLKLQPWFELEATLEPDPFRSAGGCLLVSNHRSHLDAFLLLSRVRGIRILARRSFFRIPFLGPMMWLCRQIPCENSEPASLHRAFRRVGTQLQQGQVVHVFPELTRCPRGMRGTQPFALGPFQSAHHAGATIVPIAILDSDEAWPKGSWRIHPGKRVRLRMLEPLFSASFANAVDLRAEARRRIEEALA